MGIKSTHLKKETKFHSNINDILTVGLKRKNHLDASVCGCVWQREKEKGELADKGYEWTHIKFLPWLLQENGIEGKGEEDIIHAPLKKVTLFLHYSLTT